jgi:hypothetical protein
VRVRVRVYVQEPTAYKIPTVRSAANNQPFWYRHQTVNI